MSIRSVVIVCFLLMVSPSVVFSQDSVETVVRENSSNTDTAIMNIRTNVNGVEVYVNNIYKGISPLTLENMVPATYSIQLKKDGWERKSVFVQLQAQAETNLYFELTPITGFLRITSNLKEADIYLDGTLIDIGNSTDTGLIEVQEGLHTVEIKKFGYETQSKTINIFERFLSEIVFEAKKSLFSINTFSANPMRFNPLAPSGFASSQFAFSVTAPGSITFNVYDKNNVVVYTELFDNVESAYHSAVWNGRNSLGSVLPEGEYRARLEAVPTEGWDTLSKITINGEQVKGSSFETTTIIDNSIFYPIVTAGATGTSIGIANPRLMPEGTNLISLNGAAGFFLNSGFSTVPFSINTVFTPLSVLELSFRLGLESESHTESNPPVFFGGAIKASAKLQNIYLGGVLRYTYATEPISVSVYSEPGLGFGFMAGFEVGNFLFSLSEEAVFGSEVGNVGDFDGHIKSALGIQFQVESFSSNVWAALYSPFTIDSIRIFEKLEAGADVLLLIPNTIFAPTIGCSYVYSEHKDHTIVMRFGLQFFIL